LTTVAFLDIFKKEQTHEIVAAKLIIYDNILEGLLGGGYQTLIPPSSV
jgi:hypothetical protein